MSCDRREEPKAAQAEAPTEVAEVVEAPAVEAPAVDSEPVADAAVEPSEADKALAEQQVTAFCHGADLS